MNASEIQQISKKPKTQDNIQQKKYSKIYIIVILIVLSFIGGYAYHIGNNSTPMGTIIQKIGKGLSSLFHVEKKDNGLNFSFNIEGDFETYQNEELLAKGRLKINDGEILSHDNGLKQKIKMANMSTLLENNGNTWDMNGATFEIISDNEKIYITADPKYKLGELYDTIKQGYFPYIGSVKQKNIFHKLEAVFEKGDSAMIDNSKPMLEAIGTLQNNELIKKLVIGMVTSNPHAYYENNGIYPELLKEVSNDRFLDYWFTTGEQIAGTEKIALTINTDICSDISPLIKNIIESYSPSNFLSGMDNPEVETNDIEDCKDYLSGINPMINSLLSIYKEGDIENGNFNFVISQGNNLNIILKYNNHILDTWNIGANYGDDFSLSLNGDIDGIDTSSLKVNYSSETIDAYGDTQTFTLKGEIVDGTGKIDVSGSLNGFLDTQGYISFQDYTLVDMDIQGSGSSFGISTELSIKANAETGDITFISKQEKSEHSEENVLAQLDFHYEDGAYSFDMTSPFISLSSHYSDHNFEFIGTQKEYSDNIQRELDFSYKEGKVKGKLIMEGEVATLDGHVHSEDDFDITINMNGDKKIKASATPIDTNNIKYLLDISSEDENVLSVSGEKKSSSKNGYDITHYSGDISLPSEQSQTKFNLKTSIKEGGATYNIPEKYEEVNIDMNEIFTLPDMSSAYQYKEELKPIMYVGIGGIALSTYAIYQSNMMNFGTYSEVTGHNNDDIGAGALHADDTKRMNDIKLIETAINWSYAKHKQYPNKSNFKERVSEFLSPFPEDPRGNGIDLNGCTTGYKYEVGEENKVPYSKYKLSTCLENEEKAMNDSGTLKNKYETGIKLKGYFKERFYIHEVSE